MVEDNRSSALWRGKNVVVVGMARSGRAVASLLARHGARVTGTDLRPAEALDLEFPPEAAVRLALGGHDPTLLDGADLLVVSPGIPKTAPFLADAARRNIPFLSELEVAARFARAPILALTGTNGKSTTVHVAGTLIEVFGISCVVAGNVGRALSEVVERVDETGILVVEVSSYQLEDVDRFHPVGAALLNVTPDHLDRYDSFDHYRATKLRIFACQGAGDWAVLPGGGAFDSLADRLAARVLRFGRPEEVTEGAVVTGEDLLWREGGRDERVIGLEEFPLPGRHNQANAAAAICLVRAAGLNPLRPEVRGGLRTVRALRHRMEPVGEADGVRFINDSKATNPESLEVALGAFDKPVVLIAGGRAKTGDYGRLVPLLRTWAEAIVLIGEDSGRLREAWAPAGVPIHEAGDDLREAVAWAYAKARPGGLPVLLSPGCASFDMFQDFEDRGDRFRELAGELEAAS